MLRGLPAWIDAIHVVDDASADATSAQVESVGDPRVSLHRHAHNRGVGAAIATGYRAALAEGDEDDPLIVVMAGDGQMAPGDLPSLLTPLVAKQADYSKGNRMSHNEVKRRMPTLRYLGGRTLSWLTTRAVGFRIADSQCGYTAITHAACMRLDLDDLWPRFGYPNDLLGQLAVRGLRVAEVPIEPIYAGEESMLRVWHVPTILRLIARAFVRRTRR